MGRGSWSSKGLVLLCLILIGGCDSLGNPQDPISGNPEGGTDLVDGGGGSIPGTPQTPEIPTTPGGEKVRHPSVGLSGHEFLNVQSENFEFEVTSNMPLLTPTCLRSSGFELVVLDPGHDDSSASRRSDAKDRGSNKYYFKWPKVHEGQMAQVTAYLAYEYLVSHPSLSSRESDELKTMIRFTRHPGESKFGEYESRANYGPIGGAITSSVANRRARINRMITDHRPFDSASGSWSKNTVWNVTDKALFMSVHGNSTEYWEEGDHTWMIPPKNESNLPDMRTLLDDLKESFSTAFGNFLEVQKGDSSEVARLKNGSQSSLRNENIRSREHSTNLAVLSSSVKTNQRVLLEGFVMNGKIGKLAHLDMTQNAKPKKLIFKRGSSTVKTYDVAEVYMAYAQSIARGIVNQANCN